MSSIIANKKDLYMAGLMFSEYVDGVQKLSQAVQDLECLCGQMLQETDVEKVKKMHDHGYFPIRDAWMQALKVVYSNDYSKFDFVYNETTNDKIFIEEYKKRCGILNEVVEELKQKFQENKASYVKIYADTLHNLYLGKKLGYITSDNERLKLIVEKLQAEATIKEAEIKEHEATIATENAKQAEAKAKKAEEIAKAAQAESQKKQAEAKIREADAVIADAEKSKADLAIEEHKTEQLRLQAEERKAREEEAILSVEERCRIMYNEFLNTLQSGIVNPTR